MADGIYYNADVTAADLNELATDLGSTDFSEFADGEKFGADKLNEITAHLVSKGILNRDKLCKPVIVEDKVNIQSGIIVFNNGAKKVIKDVVSVDKMNNTYVYALNDTAAGTCKLVVSEYNPETDENVTSLDYIPLAHIDGKGVLTDKRIFSEANVSIPTSNQYYETSVTINFQKGMDPYEVQQKIIVPFPIQYMFYKDEEISTRKIIVELPEGERFPLSRFTTYNEVYVERNGSEVNFYGKHYDRSYGEETFKVFFL